MRRRYHHEALIAVLTMLGTVSADAADMFAAIVAVRGDRCGKHENTVDRAALDATLANCKGDDGSEGNRARDMITCADQLTDTLSMNVLDTQWRKRAMDALWPQTSSQPRQSTEWFAEQPELEPASSDDGLVMLSADFIALLDEPLPPASPSAPVPRLDASGRRDVAMVEAIMASGAGGHLVVRRRAEAPRETGDLAALLGTDERPLLLFDGHEKGCLAAILRAELHAGALPPLVLIERDLLTKDRVSEDDEWDEPVVAKADGQVSALAAMIPSKLIGARGLYLWSVPESYSPSAAALPWIGACIGPMTFDPEWSRAVIADHLGSGLVGSATPSAITALARRVGDPRDIAAMAATARAIAAAGSTSLDAACQRVSTSFVADRRGDTGGKARFDARLLVCDPEAHHLLARAREAAANGARILAHGPPGGGKSAYVRELASRMAVGGPMRAVGPADFLAKAWGATERIVRDLWRRAEDDGAILLVDEFEVVGGRRIHGDMSGNALLIRSLTDAWLLALDEFPGVPLLATTNDCSALDNAILRRFAFVLSFGDQLSADQERLAWSVILAKDPPPGWRPVGASVADVVLAKQRCRMLGTLDPAALADSIRAARAARTTLKAVPSSGAGDQKRLH